MKIHKILCLLLSVIFTVTSVVFVTACGKEDPQSRTVESIEITSQPDKTEYADGETFDATGMVVTAKYSDGTSAVTDKYYVDKTTLKQGDTEVKISYKNKHAVVNVVVFEADFFVEIEVAISVIAALPDINDITLANISDVENARAVYETLSDEQKSRVTNFAELEAAEEKIEQLMEGASPEDVDKAIAARVTEKIAALPETDQLTLNDAETVKSVLAAYDELTANQKQYVTNYDKLTSAVAKIDQLKREDSDLYIVSYGTYSVEAEDTDRSMWKIAEYAPGGNPIEVPATPTSGDQSVGWLNNGSKIVVSIYSECDASFSFTGMMANEYFKVQGNAKVTLDGNELSLVNSETELTASAESQYHNWIPVEYNAIDITEGMHELAIEFVGATCNVDCMYFDITNNSETRTLSGIEIATPPSKTQYVAGEKFDPSGMTVKAVYDNGDKEAVSAFVYDKTGTLKGTETEVTVTYLGKTAPVSIGFANEVKIQTPDNSQEKLMYIGNYAGNSFVEIDRATDADGNKTSMFTDKTAYVLMHIYTSSDADVDTGMVGALKLTANLPLEAPSGVSGNGAVMSTLNGSSTLEVINRPSDFYIDNQGNAGVTAIRNLIAEALGEAYSADASYYFAFQVIAVEEEINGVTYTDSGISAIGTTAW